MVKSREESERDPAHSVCFAFRATVATKLRGAEKRKREEERNWEVLRKRKKREKKEQERKRAGSPGFLSHPLRLPVLSLTHRPTFYLTYLVLAFNIIRHSACFYFNTQDMMCMLHLPVTD